MIFYPPFLRNFMSHNTTNILVDMSFFILLQIYVADFHLSNIFNT